MKIVGRIVFVGMVMGSCAWADPLQDLMESTTSAAVIPAGAQSTVDLLQPDFDPALLENLAVPTEAPSRVALPLLVIKKNEWRGSQCGIVQPHQLVFRNPASWKLFWEKAMAPYSERLKQVPMIDFSKDMVVGVFLGEKPIPYYEIQILSTKFENRAAERVLVVRYRSINKMQGVFTPPFAIQPFNLKRMPLTRGPVTFIQGQR
jgi:hypothetical protein